MALFLSPIGNDQTIDANGDPLVAGQIETYLAGSSTPAATYTDDTGGTPQSNPIILNSLGWPTLGPIWLTEGVSYKFIIKDSLGVTLRTIDDISGINDASVSQSEWIASGFVPTFIDATNFSVPGDQTAVLQINRRLRTTNTSGFIYSTITNSVFAAGNTTVTVVNDSGSLDAGLSAVAYALLSAEDDSVPAINVSRFTTSARRFLGRNDSTSGPVEALTLTESALMQPARIQPISASVGSNALTLTLNPTALDFRSATLGSGAIVTRDIPTALTLVVSSGSTLGTTSAVASTLAVLAIDNAGTVELAVVNLAGNNLLDESELISTTAEGGAGGADSATVIYSTTARSNVAFRIVGYVTSTQATAGTWATAPSLIQGFGSNLPLTSSKRTQIQIGTAVTLTTQTSVDFTGIPSWVKRITVMFNGVSTNGTSQILIQIGDSGGIENTGYSSAASYGTAAGQFGTSIAGFLVDPTASAAAAALRYGHVSISTMGSNVWTSKGGVYNTTSLIDVSNAGAKILSDTLTQVRITTVGGVDQFDAGTLNVSWE